MKTKNLLLLAFAVLAFGVSVTIPSGQVAAESVPKKYRNYEFITPSGQGLYPSERDWNEYTGHTTLYFDYNGVNLDVKYFKKGKFDARKYNKYRVKLYSGKLVQSKRFKTDFQGRPAIQLPDKSVISANVFKNKYYNVQAQYKKYRYVNLKGKQYRPTDVMYASDEGGQQKNTQASETDLGV